MDIHKFLKTIYLGDRACKSILIDGWRSEVKLQVDCISRTRGETWNYYVDEDINDGFVVFEGVKTISFSPTGHIPNDYINSLVVREEFQEEPKYLFEVSVGSVDSSANYTEIIILIRAKSIALEDKDTPEKRIKN